MTRWIWRGAVFVLALVVCAAAFAPAAIVAPQRPGFFTYDHAEGSIWRARLDGARLGPYQAGVLLWRLSLWHLTQSRIVADFAFTEGALNGEVRILGNWRGDRRIVAQALRVDGAPLGRNLMLAGETTISGLDVHFEHGHCRAAAGAIESDVLARNAAALRWRGPALAGSLRCAGDVARAIMSGAGEDGPVNVTLDLNAAGEARWRAALQTAKPELQASLAAAGFRPEADAHEWVLNGEMRWLPF